MATKSTFSQASWQRQLMVAQDDDAKKGRAFVA